METVRLKNGSEELKQLVNITMLSLNGLIKDGRAMIIYELVELCLNPQHQLFGDSGKVLTKLSLISNLPLPKVHQCIKNIVLSAVEGSGPDLVLVNPIR